MIFKKAYNYKCLLLIFTAAILLTGLVQGVTITVSPSESIQTAIDRADSGDIILVEYGIYRENLNVNKSLTLKGIGMPVINTSRTGNAITLSTNQIKIEGFEVSNNFCGIYLNISSNNTIKGNKITDNDYGIVLDSSSNNIISENYFADNSIANIFIYLSRDIVIRDNTNSQENCSARHNYNSVILSNSNVYYINNISQNRTCYSEIDPSNTFDITKDVIEIELFGYSIILGNVLHLANYEVYEPTSCTSLNSELGFVSASVGSINLLELYRYLGISCLAEVSDNTSAPKQTETIDEGFIGFYQT